jgi:hypothetical protein
MSTPVVPVVEPEVKERQETDAYIAERAKERNAPPPPVIVETTKPATPEELAAAIPEPLKGKSAEEIKAVLDNAIPPEMVDRQAVDAYITERDKTKKRKNRGGAQARIDELTKEKADAEAKAATLEKEKTELAAKAPETKPVETPSVETPKTQPKMNEFTDVEQYYAAMALWAAKENGPTAVAAPAATPPPKEPEYLQVRKEEFDKFLENGKKFVVAHPDFDATLQAAHVRGLTMSEMARTTITRLAVPEVAYWLAKPENDLAARTFMKMDDLQQSAEVGKIAERLAVRPSDFVSNAPSPGIRLTGNTNGVRPSLQELAEQNQTDEYLRERKMQKRSGMRR